MRLSLMSVENYLVSIQKWLFFTISASDSNFNAQNTQSIPALKILVFLDFAKNLSFLDRHFRMVRLLDRGWTIE
jgi:hypothetical protein